MTELSERAELARLYDEMGSVSAVARHYGVPVPTMRSRFVRLEIPMKSRGYRSPKGASTKGPGHHNWRGGTYTRGGYIWEYAPDHPVASKGYVPQHRLVMERALGRLLTADELVHHVNEDKADNRRENLELMTRSTHARLHRQTTSRDTLGRFAA